MNTRLPLSGWCAALIAASTGLCFGQTAEQPNTAPASAASVVQPVEAAAQLTQEQIDELTGPIALYPDPLIAQILPAATYPTDIVLAARMVSQKAAPEELDAQPWDPAVKAIARYPSIIKMMDERLDWTAQLGAAFERQPEDVMNSIQRLRQKARAMGHLSDTPQQQVIVEDAQPDTTIIRIVPASPQVVYVPSYDPAIVYYRPYRVSYVASPFIWFGAGFAIGSWLNLDCDWYRGGCYYPVGWSWSNCYYPSWRLHFSWWHRTGYWSHSLSYWCAPSYHRHHHWHGHHDRHHGRHGHYAHGHRDHHHHDAFGRTNDAHIRTSSVANRRTNDTAPRIWTRDDSRRLPYQRTSIATRDSASASVPGHRRTTDSKPGLVTDRLAGSRRSADRISDTTRRDDVATGSRDSLRRTPMTPEQIRDRLSRGSRTDTSPRASDRVIPGNRRIDTSPRASDRVIPGNRRSTPQDRGVNRVAPGNTVTAPGTDALKRTTRPTPPASTGKSVNRSSSPVVVPGSGQTRPSTGAVRTIPPSRSVSPSTRSTSPGRQGLQRSPSSSKPAARPASPSPSRSASPARSSSPSRSAAPASRGSSPGHKRGGK